MLILTEGPDPPHGWLWQPTAPTGSSKSTRGGGAVHDGPLTRCLTRIASKISRHAPRPLPGPRPLPLAMRFPLRRRSGRSHRRDISGQVPSLPLWPPVGWVALPPGTNDIENDLPQSGRAAPPSRSRFWPRVAPANPDAAPPAPPRPSMLASTPRLGGHNGRYVEGAQPRPLPCLASGAREPPVSPPARSLPQNRGRSKFGPRGTSD